MLVLSRSIPVLVDETRLLRVSDYRKGDWSAQGNVDIDEKKCIAGFLFPIASQGCLLKFCTK